MYSDKYLNSLKKDFRNFCHHIWQVLELPVLTPVQNDIAFYLQHAPKRCQVSAFRGVGKSYLTAAFVCWNLWKDKELSILVLSAGKSRADAFAIFVRNMIRDTDILKHLEPDKSKGERATQNMFDMHNCKPKGSPSLMSAGITSQITGMRADIIIADDIEVVSNSATHALRDKLATLVTELDAILTPQGRTIYLGTPQTELSLYNTLYARGYEMKIWTALVPTDKQAEGYGAKLAQMIRDMMLVKDAGLSTDPKRFTDEDLAERQLSYGKSGFALQFMLDTSLSDGDKFPLKINDLVIDSVNNKLPNEVFWSNNPLNKMKDLHNVSMAGQNFYSPSQSEVSFSAPQMTILSIDPSGRGKDETAYTVAHLLNGNIFIPKLGGVKGGYTDDVMKELSNIAKQYKVNKVIVESNFGDGMFTQLLKPHLNRIYPCTMEEVRQHQQKELRIIDTLEPLMNQHRLIIDPKVINDDYDSAFLNFSSDKATQYMFIYQLSRISKDRGSLRHDDRLDSLAIACKYFLDSLDVDQQMQNKIAEEAKFAAQLESFTNDWYDEHGTGNQSLKLWGR